MKNQIISLKKQIEYLTKINELQAEELRRHRIAVNRDNVAKPKNFTIMKYLLIFIVFVSAACKEDELYKLTLYAECDDCDATFIYPDGTTQTITLLNEFASDEIMTESGSVTVSVNSYGYAYLEISLDDEIRRAEQIDSGYSEVSYAIVSGTRHQR